MDISALLQTIPEDANDEALRSIDSITTFPAENSARIRCFLSREFRLSLRVRRDATVEITAEGRKPVFCTPAGRLRRTWTSRYGTREPENGVNNPPVNASAL